MAYPEIENMEQAEAVWEFDRAAEVVRAAARKVYNLDQNVKLGFMDPEDGSCRREFLLADLRTARKVLAKAEDRLNEAFS